MINVIARAKHWQVFIVITGIFFFIATSKNIPITILSETALVKSLKFLRIINLGGLILWLWAVATAIQEISPKNLKMNRSKLNILSCISFVYLIIYILFLERIFTRVEHSQKQILLLFHITSIIGILYLMYFTAKSLKTIELQKKVNFKHFFIDFLLLLLYPIGVWFIQPRINTLFKENPTPTIEQ